MNPNPNRTAYPPANPNPNPHPHPSPTAHPNTDLPPVAPAGRIGAVEKSVHAALRAATALSPQAAGVLAYYLFRRPFARGRVRSTERETHARASVGRITVNGKRVVTYRWGDGTDPVLMLHGWQSRTSRYAPYVPELLARGLSPIGFDAPGHGDSGGRHTTLLEYADAARQLQERYGEFHTVMANSLGTLGAFEALRSGVRTRSVVTFSAVSEPEYLLDYFSDRVALDPRVKAALRARADARLLAPETDIWLRYRAASDPAAVTVPILVVHDEEDEMVPADLSRRLAAAFPERARLLTTRGLGHRRVLSDVDLRTEVLAFLDAIPLPHRQTESAA
ncbi:alpha/beta hydrolase [Streptomyces sp. SID3343]|uniref:alpha/beta hydrolase n=1 Tax=Streptomyces sp. SID3343 TaxID=2690260 RepID=UPI0013705839|nr:alpha/beta hydrolase [Streptomyces sp. SID3343]MYW01950.1 alpha/beta fold hydrolase [Streptomyces sp. SID3343]